MHSFPDIQYNKSKECLELLIYIVYFYHDSRVLNQRSKFAFYFKKNFRAIFRILNFNALHKRHFSSKRLIEQVLLTICLLMLANKSFPIKGMTLANEHSLTYFNRY